MAIGTDDSIDKFGTVAVELTTSPANVAAGAFSIASDTSTVTNSDDAQTTTFVLKVTAAGLSGAPTAGTVVNLYAQWLNIDGSTGDMQEPTANFPHDLLGSFAMKDIDAENNIPLRSRLLNTKPSAEFIPFIQNLSAVDLGTTWQLFETNTASGPHP